MKPTSFEFYEHTRKDPYIIAEIGSTWKVDNGKDDLENCLTCINMAAEYGATAVKFQMFTHKELYGVDGDDKYALPRQFIPKLAEYAEDRCIDFMCSAFSLEGFKYLDPYVKMHKVASSKVGDQRLLDWASAQDKPFLVSDGMFDVSVWGNFIPMICASEYPAAIDDYDLSNIFRYAAYGPWGFSDHTTRYTLARIMRTNGCSYFEKHVDFLMAGRENPDFEHSLMGNQFGYYTDVVRKTEVGRPKIVKSQARKKWGDRWDNEGNGYFRPKA